MARKELPPREALLQLLCYDAETGALTWRPRPDHPAFTTRWGGKPAFTAVERGYLQGRIFGRLYYAHRIIWRMETGDIPNDIDHINGDRADNRWKNLRNVSRQVNLRNRALSSNNRTGAHGVSLTPYATWQAYIGDGEKSVCLGSFRTMEEAVRARRLAEQRLGYHANHGRNSGMAAPGNPVAVGDVLRRKIEQRLKGA